MSNSRVIFNSKHKIANSKLVNKKNWNDKKCSWNKTTAPLILFFFGLGNKTQKNKKRTQKVKTEMNRCLNTFNAWAKITPGPELVGLVVVVSGWCHMVGCRGKVLGPINQPSYWLVLYYTLRYHYCFVVHIIQRRDWTFSATCTQWHI